MLKTGSSVFIYTFLFCLVVIILRLFPVVDPIGRYWNRSIIRDNSQSNTDRLTLENNAQIDALNEEIERLKNELKFTQNQIAGNFVGARVVSKTADSFRLAVKIDRGSEDGLMREGLPVLHNGYLIGVISHIEPYSSIVTLVGDNSLAIPVIIEGRDGIVIAESGGVVIDKVVNKGGTNITPESTVFTSGLDGLYPPGLLVGTVGQEIDREVFSRYSLNLPYALSEIKYVVIDVGI